MLPAPRPECLNFSAGTSKIKKLIIAVRTDPLVPAKTSDLREMVVVLAVQT